MSEQETKHYADGTTATGMAPLPELSPKQQLSAFAAEWLKSIEIMTRGTTGPSIQLRGYIAALEAELATVKRAKANNDQHLDHYYAEVRRLREELAASQATIAKMRVWRSKNEQTD